MQPTFRIQHGMLCCFIGINIKSLTGYRCFKAIMFLSGLLFGSVIIFLLCYKERVLDTQLSIEASAGIGLGIGLLCGLVTMLVRSVGLFMTGILLGLLLAIAGLLLTHQLYTPSTLWVSTQCIQYFQLKTHIKGKNFCSINTHHSVGTLC